MKTVSVKKSVAFLIALCMIVSMVASFGSVSANAANPEVSLYMSDMYYYRHSFISRYIYIKTDAASADQQVFVHYESGENQPWEDQEAVFVEYLPDGSKLWKADVTSSGYKTAYAIKYVANGNTYWDNNGGSNYDLEALGCAPVTAQRAGYPGYYNHYSPSSVVTAVLQNYAYEKNVFVRYTNDGWNTYTDAAMSYDSTNDDGTENWKATISMTADDSDDFEFCICYEANGSTYWANNFGRNYGAYYCVGR